MQSRETEVKPGEQASFQPGKRPLSRTSLLLKAVTPAILVAGLITLLVAHFSMTLAGYQQQVDQSYGAFGFAAGHLAVRLDRDSAQRRPVILYDGNAVFAVNEALSTITVDGQRQELWNGNHGYSQDVGKHQIFSTASGTGWQVVEITQLLNDQSVSITYQLAIHGEQATSPPHQVVVEITHEQHVWSNPQISGNSFTAIALPPPPAALANTLVQPIGTVQMQVSGAYLVGGSLTANTQQDKSGAAGASEPWANSVTTTYVVNQPPAQTLIPLGTEIITFTPAHDATPVVFPSGG